ncbi:MAG: ribosomal-protein-alanine N-acetyltransferase [Pseudohongiellaceae bacterium]|jgi:ribosomal-protein-alanine N-acetyltransferase
MTTSILIRSPALDDRDEFLERVRASRSLLGNWVLPPDTPALFESYIERSAQDNQCCFLVCLESTGEIAGVINGGEIVRGCFLSSYLGFYGFVPHAGTGVMTLGLAAVITQLFGEEGLHRVEANIQPANSRSLALVQRLGFAHEGFSPRYLKIAGRWRDHERWALLSDDWQGLPPPQ